jgi:hypothetical protein
LWFDKAFAASGGLTTSAGANQADAIESHVIPMIPDAFGRTLFDLFCAFMPKYRAILSRGQAAQAVTLEKA